MAEFNTSAGLFEVNLPDFKQLKQCRKEIVLLKQLWDYVFIVRTSIADWKTMPWSNIDCEQMEMDCKKFAKDIRALDKEMRAWDTYLGVEGVVKNMITSLRAVAELQNNAIRDRHWQQLMKATGVCRHLPRNLVSFNHSFINCNIEHYRVSKSCNGLVEN